MCANYMGIYDVDLLSTFYGATAETGFDERRETWPVGTSPFIRLDKQGRRLVEMGLFGLLPSFAKETAYGRNTYNSRTETVETKPSFRNAWKNSQRCIIPAEYIFEPYYAPVEIYEPPSKPVRWRIWQENGDPMAIAGLYNTWHKADGSELLTFTMLMVNADRHPFMSRFHAPGDEKRMAVILDPDEMDDWLTCSHDEAKRYFRMWHGELTGEPAPLARQSKPKVQKAPKPPKPPQPYTPDLFE